MLFNAAVNISVVLRLPVCIAWTRQLSVWRMSKELCHWRTMMLVEFDIASPSISLCKTLWFTQSEIHIFFNLFRMFSLGPSDVMVFLQLHHTMSHIIQLVFIIFMNDINEKLSKFAWHFTKTCNANRVYCLCGSLSIPCGNIFYLPASSWVLIDPLVSLQRK